MSKLRQYLQTTGTKAGEFAKKVEISPNYLSELINGKRTPKLDLAWRIETATGGQVSMQSWLESDHLSSASSACGGKESSHVATCEASETLETKGADHA